MSTAKGFDCGFCGQHIDDHEPWIHLGKKKCRKCVNEYAKDESAIRTQTIHTALDMLHQALGDPIPDINAWMDQLETLNLETQVVLGSAVLCNAPHALSFTKNGRYLAWVVAHKDLWKGRIKPPGE